MRLDYRDKKQFLAAIRKLAKSNKVTPQIMLQEVVLDELLDKIAHSRFRDNLVLKGGFLIASLLGTDTRSTRDIDTSIKGLPVEKTEILNVFQEICQIELPNDDIRLQITSIKDIRETAEYSGYRLHIRTKIFTSLVDVKIDVTTGDVITERAVNYGHKLLLENRTIEIMAYNVETIIAEKLQTIVNLGTLNTRLKDYYDLYMFANKQPSSVDFELLRKAIIATAENRNDTKYLGHYAEHIKALIDDDVLATHWLKYQSENSYAVSITFKDTCTAALKLVKESQIDLLQKD